MKHFWQQRGIVWTKFRDSITACSVPPDIANSPEYQTFWSDLAADVSNTGEFKRVNRLGDVLWLRASYSPDYDNSGKVVSVTKLASDITQERKIKERTIDISTTTSFGHR